MKNYISILKNVPLFYQIKENDIEPLLNCLGAKTTEYKNLQPVFLVGTKAEYVGIVLKGQLQIIQEDYFGNRNIISKITEGQMFAEAFVGAEAEILPVSVFASANSEIMLIKYHKIANPCSSTCTFHSKLIFNMMRIMAQKNIMLTRKIEVISKRTTKEKLLAYLSYEAKKSKSNSFDIPFNRQELADYLSVERSAMSAELCKLRDQNILKFNKNHFTLL